MAMGSDRSGNWGPKSNRPLVDTTLCLDVALFRPALPASSTGVITWDDRGAALNYAVRWNIGSLQIVLDYRHPDGEDIRLVVPLQRSATRAKGGWWWFTCPLVADGVVCQKRVGNLYLPCDQKRFGCRACHKLVYRSSRTAHQEERFLKRAGKFSDTHPLFGFAAAVQAADAALGRSS